jgi:hypothetical protein
VTQESTWKLVSRGRSTDPSESTVHPYKSMPMVRTCRLKPRGGIRALELKGELLVQGNMVQFPTSSHVLLEPPSAGPSAETLEELPPWLPPEGLTDLQRILLESVFKAMTGNAVKLHDFRPMPASEMGNLLGGGLQFRTRGVPAMLLAALILRPLSTSIVERVGEFAKQLGVEERLITRCTGICGRIPRACRDRFRTQRLHSQQGAFGRRRIALGERTRNHLHRDTPPGSDNATIAEVVAGD